MHTDTGHEVGQHDLLDARLAERGKHPVDVAQEDAVRSDHEHALVLEREPVGVEEIGGAVERDHGLAGARPALHDEHAAQLGADDLVLLRLDRRHDVAELARARLLERGEEGTGPDEIAVGRDRRVEHLVFDAEQRAASHREVTPAGETHRRASRRPVERLGDRRSPVDNDGFLSLVGDRQAADVEGLAGRPVDAAEHQGSVADLEVGQTAPDGLLDHVSLVAGLVRAAAADLGEAPQTLGLRLRPIEAVVRTLDVGLLFGELGVLRHRPSRGGWSGW